MSKLYPCKKECWYDRNSASEKGSRYIYGRLRPCRNQYRNPATIVGGFHEEGGDFPVCRVWLSYASGRKLAVYERGTDCQVAISSRAGSTTARNCAGETGAIPLLVTEEQPVGFRGWALCGGALFSPPNA